MGEGQERMWVGGWEGAAVKYVREPPWGGGSVCTFGNWADRGTKHRTGCAGHGQNNA